MNAFYRSARLPVFATLGLLISASAHAAQLTTVNGWSGGVTLPSDVTMSIYVPDKLAANPPLVTVIHYCGGSASAVFGQAKDIKAAADKYGFIMILPAQTHSGGCWDVSSKKTQTHDGGGDTHAIAQMVKYAISQYKANANRVYSTGDSSGGMMTQLLMAVYPDIFKAGSAFAGVPAGCSNVFDGSGLCGLPAQTAQQWGDRVRAMYPGYTGHRPRLQLVHGDADTTITFKNQAEAIKEWTNVLGLTVDPTTKVDSGLTLGNHQAKRQQWKDSCGYVAFDVLTSVGGDHGPSDALFQGNFVLPFLGLDSQAAVDAALDSQIAQCGDGGKGGAGSGGTSSSGGTAGGGATSSGGKGGSSGGGSSGGSASGGATSGTGGSVGNGGGAGANAGGAAGTPSTSAGGNSGGTSGTGAATGGIAGTGGVLNTGGTTGGAPVGAGGTGGSSPVTGGLPGASGSSTTATGGTSSGNSGSPDMSESGCTIGNSRTGTSTGILALALGLLAFRRRRR
ncbi:MAG TPA: PHB depolymerase family esterase [Polyangiaceae bacterium]|nr:PHB depolymerase family esterase [Polyangiaceae bacterium]